MVMRRHIAFNDHHILTVILLFTTIYLLVWFWSENESENSIWRPQVRDEVDSKVISQSEYVVYAREYSPDAELAARISAKIKRNLDKFSDANEIQLRIQEEWISRPDESIHYVAENVSNRLPWFFRSGNLRPSWNEMELNIWPDQDESDRIVSQLMWVNLEETDDIKKIFLSRWNFSRYPLGREFFIRDNCPVNQCEIVSERFGADAVVFEDRLNLVRTPDVPQEQIWVWHLQESPYQIKSEAAKDSINLTSSYRSDSHIVVPYAKWVYYDDNIRKIENHTKNYAAGKTAKAAWFVSNCQANNSRMKYALKLQKHYHVDIYGKCGNKQCTKKDNKCYDLLSKKYRYYLAFENSNCRDYISEKFFLNGLSNNVIPIAMGARSEDYAEVAPESSYIHVDHFASPSDLANYLRFLDENPDIYNSYFWWKGTGEFINPHFLCRLCAMLHAPRHNNTLFSKEMSFLEWWSNDEMCRRGSWND